MFGPFSSTKALQAIRTVLKASERAPGRFRVLNLLYIADREALEETHSTITCDTPYAMVNGPVLSRTYDLLKGTGRSSSLARQFLDCRDERAVRLIADPGTGELSACEVDKIGEVASRFDAMSDSQLRDYVHAFPEYLQNKPPSGSSRAIISVDDLLAATGLSEKKALLMNEAKAVEAFDRMLAQARAETAPERGPAELSRV